MTLLESFSEVTDYRRGQGKRVDLDQLLSMVVISYLCGHTGYRPVARFCRIHEDILQEELQLRHRIPSYVTFREVLKNLDTKELVAAFNKWSGNFVPIEKGDWLSGDGKVLASTVTDANGSGQNFQAVVSLFCQRSGLVKYIDEYHNKEKGTGEGNIARFLIKKLRGMGLVFTLDALHCQKKR